MGDDPGFNLPKSDVPAGRYPMPPIPGAEGDGGRRPGPQRSGPDNDRNAGGYRLPWPAGGEGSTQERERPRSGSGMDLPTSSPPAGDYPMPPMPPSPEGDDYGGATGSQRGGGSAFPFPLPGPGRQGQTDNPYGDLSDILRRGGRLPSGEQAGGRGLGSIVRDTIGSALGFGKKGIVGWIIQLLLLRWGWGFLKRILFGR